MGQFAEAAERAYDMSEMKAYVSEYLGNRGLACGQASFRDSLRLAYSAAAKDFLSQVVHGVLRYLREKRKLSIDAGADLFVNGPSGLRYLSEIARSSAKKDTLLRSLAEDGLRQIASLWDNPETKSDNELYDRLLVCELLAESLLEARSEEPEMHLMWTADAASQYQDTVNASAKVTEVRQEIEMKRSVYDWRPTKSRGSLAETSGHAADAGARVVRCPVEEQAA